MTSSAHRRPQDRRRAMAPEYQTDGPSRWGRRPRWRLADVRGKIPWLADGVFGPLRRVGAEELHVVPEQGGHANGGMGAELFDVEPETVGVSGAQFLLSDTTGGPVLHDHPEAVDDLTVVPCRRVVRSAGAVARGLVAYDVNTVGPDTQVADVREE